MLRRINEALPGLVAGIVLYGVVVELAGVWFVDDKLHYSVGLWYGIAIAVGMAINLATVIFDAVALGDSAHANRRIIAKSLLRYVVVAVLFFLLGLFDIGNILMAFLGVLGLKVSAYLQPLLHKIADKLSGRGGAAPDDEVIENAERSDTGQQNESKEVIR